MLFPLRDTGFHKKGIGIPCGLLFFLNLFFTFSQQSKQQHIYCTDTDSLYSGSNHLSELSQGENISKGVQVNAYSTATRRLSILKNQEHSGSVMSLKLKTIDSRGSGKMPKSLVDTAVRQIYSQVDLCVFVLIKLIPEQFEVGSPCLNRKRYAA